MNKMKIKLYPAKYSYACVEVQKGSIGMFRDVMYPALTILGRIGHDKNDRYKKYYVNARHVLHLRESIVCEIVEDNLKGVPNNDKSII